MRKIDEIKNNMVSFTCHKTVKAIPMNRKDYNDLRGWSVPSDENPEVISLGLQRMSLIRDTDCLRHLLIGLR